MTVSKKSIDLDYDIHMVWEVLTSHKNYRWRSDIKNLQSLNYRQFIECSNDGITTVFTTTLYDLYNRWEFDMENVNMKGHWIGTLTEIDGGTRLTLEENVEAKRFILKPLLGGYLKRQQAQYVVDLKAELAKRSGFNE